MSEQQEQKSEGTKSEEQIKQEQVTQNRGALGILQFMHNKFLTHAFYPEEFDQAHQSLKFIEQLAKDLDAKIYELTGKYAGEIEAEERKAREADRAKREAEEQAKGQAE